MADRNYLIEILLAARDEMSAAFAKATAEIEGLDAAQKKQAITNKAAIAGHKEYADEVSRGVSAHKQLNEALDKTKYKTGAEVEEVERLSRAHRNAILAERDHGKESDEYTAALSRVQRAERSLAEEIGKRNNWNVGLGTIIARETSDEVRFQEVVKHSIVIEAERANKRTQYARDQSKALDMDEVRDRQIAATQERAFALNEAKTRQEGKMQTQAAAMDIARTKQIAKDQTQAYETVLAARRKVDAYDRASAANIKRGTRAPTPLSEGILNIASTDIGEGSIPKPQSALRDSEDEFDRAVNRMESKGSAMAKWFKDLFSFVSMTSIQPIVTAIVGLISVFASLASAGIAAGAAMGTVFASMVAQGVPVMGVLSIATQKFTQVMSYATTLFGQQQQAFIAQYTAAEQASIGINQVTDAEHSYSDALFSLQSTQIQAKESELSLLQTRQQATRQLQDLVIAEESAKLAAESSSLAVGDAQKALLQAMSTGGDVAQAQLQLQGAQIANQQTALGSQRAVADAANGSLARQQISQQVADAQRAVTEAQRAVVDSQYAATAARAAIIQAKQTASGYSVATQAALAYLRKQLTTGELAVANSIVRILNLFKGNKSRFAFVGDDIIGSIGPALDRVYKLLTTDPKLYASMKHLTQSIGGAIRSVLNVILSPAAVGGFEKLADAAARNMVPLASIVGNLFKIAGTFVTQAIPYVHLFALFMEQLIDKAEKWITSKPGKNWLATFFYDAFNALKGFISLGVAIGELIASIITTGGGAKAGTGALQTLTDTVNRITKSINDHGKAWHFLQTMWSTVIPTMKDIGGLLKGILDTVISLTSSNRLGTLATLFTHGILPALVVFAKVTGLVGAGIAMLLRIPGANQVVGIVAGLSLSFIELSKGLKLLLVPLAGIIKIYETIIKLYEAIKEIAASGGVFSSLKNWLTGDSTAATIVGAFKEGSIIVANAIRGALASGGAVVAEEIGTAEAAGGGGGLLTGLLPKLASVIGAGSLGSALSLSGGPEALIGWYLNKTTQQNTGWATASGTAKYLSRASNAQVRSYVGTGQTQGVDIAGGVRKYVNAFVSGASQSNATNTSLSGLKSLYDRAKLLISLPDVTAPLRASLTKLISTLTLAIHQFSPFNNSFNNWYSAFQKADPTMGNVLGQIRQSIDQNVSGINSDLTKGTKQWRGAITGTFSAAISDIQTLFSQGQIGANQYIANITSILNQGITAAGGDVVEMQTLLTQSIQAMSQAATATGKSLLGPGGILSQSGFQSLTQAPTAAAAGLPAKKAPVKKTPDISIPNIPKTNLTIPPIVSTPSTPAIAAPAVPAIPAIPGAQLAAGGQAIVGPDGTFTLPLIAPDTIAFNMATLAIYAHAQKISASVKIWLANYQNISQIFSQALTAIQDYVTSLSNAQSLLDVGIKVVNGVMKKVAPLNPIQAAIGDLQVTQKTLDANLGLYKQFSDDLKSAQEEKAKLGPMTAANATQFEKLTGAITYFQTQLLSLGTTIAQNYADLLANQITLIQTTATQQLRPSTLALSYWDQVQSVAQSLGTSGAIGRTGNIAAIINSTQANFATADNAIVKYTQAQLPILQHEYDVLLAKSKTDKSPVLQQALDDAYTALQTGIAAVATAQAQAMSDAMQAQSDQAQYQSNVVSVANTIATVQTGLGNLIGGAQAAIAASQLNKSYLQSQYSATQSLLTQAEAQGNTQAILTLTEQLQTLGASIDEATLTTEQAIDAYHQVAIGILSGTVQAQSGLFSAATQITQTLGQISGSQNLPALIQQGKQQAVNLTTQGQQAVANAQQGVGYQWGTTASQQAQGSGILSTLISAYQQGPQAFANALQSVSQQYGSLLSNLPASQQTTLSGLVQALIDNTTATVSNTANLQQLEATTNQQNFSSSAWSQFRDAIFNGMGQLLPSYAMSVPSMDVGGTIHRTGILLGHAGETITPATVSKGSTNGSGRFRDLHTHAHITNPTEVADPVHISNAIAWKLNHDPNTR